MSNIVLFFVLCLASLLGKYFFIIRLIKADSEEKRFLKSRRLGKKMKSIKDFTVQTLGLKRLVFINAIIDFLLAGFVAMEFLSSPFTFGALVLVAHISTLMMIMKTEDRLERKMGE